MRALRRMMGGANVMRCVGVVAIGLACREAAAQRGLRDIPAPDPAAELAAMEVAEGYEVNLFAADPLISKPLQMQFDTRGRLWVSSSSVYPQIRPGEVADDTVTVLEDRDGDGRADAATTFADGLLMPTGVLPDDKGGAYVANSTELLHLADTDGDGRADRRQVALSGFGAEDTHHIIHTFRRGPDARIYFSQSIYIHSHVETPKGVRRLNGGGIWRFRPEEPGGLPGTTFALDVFARGWVNTWGHAFDRWGRSLATDGAGGEGLYHAFPGAAYQAAVGVPRILHGMNPGSPKYCGLEIVDGGHLPPDAQGLAITADFRANRVCRFRVAERGAGFASEKLTDLIHGRRVTFRPIDVKMGPDGAIYIADWYNPIIQHGEVDFRDDRRDRTHGRIWRVTAKGRPLLPRIDFTRCTQAELLGHLQAADGYRRDMARRELVARGREAVMPLVPAFLAAADAGRADAAGADAIRLEALWLAQAFDRGTPADVDRPLLTAVLAAADPRARAAACRVVADWADRLDDPAGMLAAAVDDPAPPVRLEGVRALASVGGRRAAELALHAVDHDRDDALDYAVWLTARELRDAWLPAVLAGGGPGGTFDDGGRLSRLVFAIRAADAAPAIPWLVGRLRAGDVSPADRRAALECIAALGGPAELRIVYDAAIAAATPPADAAALLERLADAHARRRAKPAGDLAAVGGLLAGPLAPQAILLAGAWEVPGAVAPLVAIAEGGGPPDRRHAAIAALGRIPGEASRRPLERLATDADESIAAAAVAALVPGGPEAAARLAVPLLARAREQAVQGAVFGGFLAVKDGPPRLAAAIDAALQPLPAAVARRGLEAVGSSGRQEPALSRSLERSLARSAGAAPDGGRDAAGAAAGATVQRHAMNARELEAFVAAVRGPADPRRGEAIYKRESLRCTACHRIGDHGPRVGPNLAAIGAASQLDYIIDSLVHPAKNVKEGFNSVVVLTADGRVVTGIPIGRGDVELVLRDANDKEVRIPIADVEEESPGTSLMPAGLVDTLSREELADLVRYLSELGR